MSRLADRYTVGRELGRGRTSVVHEAHDEDLDQRIAIKVVDAAHREDPAAIDRLRRALENSHRVSHPGVCRVFDVNVDAGVCTMELLDGETLEHRLSRGSVPPDLAAAIVSQLDRALTAMHEAGVAHTRVRAAHVVVCGSRAVLVGLGGSVMSAAGAEADRDALGSIARALGVAAPRRRLSRRATRAVAVAVAVAACLAVAGAATWLAGGWTSRRERTIGRAARRATGPLARWIELDGAGQDMIEGAARDADGNLYLCGHVTAGARLVGIPLDHPGGAAMAGVVASFDPDGGIRWKRVLATVSRVATVSIVVDRDLVFVSGLYKDGELELGNGHRLSARGSSGFVVALSAHDGTTRWARSIDATEARVKASTLASDGSIHVVGEYRGTLTIGGTAFGASPGRSLFVASFDRDGTLRWATAPTVSQETRMHVIASRDGSVIVGGEVSGELVIGRSRWKPFGWGAFLAAFDETTGQPRWVRPLGAPESSVRGVTSTGALLAVGDFHGELDLGEGLRLSSTGGAWQGWIAELEPSTGEVRWARSLATAPVTTHRAVVRLPDERLAIVATVAAGVSLGGTRFDVSGPNDLLVTVVSGKDGPMDARMIRGPGREVVKTAQLLTDGWLAILGNHQGLTIGDVTVRGQGHTDGFYAELRVDQLFTPESASGSR